MLICAHTRVHTYVHTHHTAVYAHVIHINILRRNANMLMCTNVTKAVIEVQ